MLKISLYDPEDKRVLEAHLRDTSCSTQDKPAKPGKIYENKVEGDVYYIGINNWNILHILAENEPGWMHIFQNYIGDYVFEKLAQIKGNDNKTPVELCKEPQFASLFEIILTKPALS